MKLVFRLLVWIFVPWWSIRSNTAIARVAARLPPCGGAAMPADAAPPTPRAWIEESSCANLTSSFSSSLLISFEEVLSSFIYSVKGLAVKGLMAPGMLGAGECIVFDGEKSEHIKLEIKPKPVDRAGPDLCVLFPFLFWSKKLKKD